jgi:6-phospho-3-hexuloisomerase
MRVKQILKEINQVFKTADKYQWLAFMNEIIRADNIVVVGAGRMGLTCKGFSMRLNHLGLNASFLGDSNVSKADLMIIASGSGETQTIYDLAKKAKKLCLITTNPNSRIGKLAKVIVELNVEDSKQPMKTLMEQSTQIFFDAMVLELMDLLSETNDSMSERHTDLE